MKKRLICILAAISILLYGSAAHANTEELLSGIGKKLMRGVVNVFTGWVEIPAQTFKGYESGLNGDGKNKIGGAVVGIFTGVWHGAGRTISGMGDLAGFWAADPESNEGVGVPLDGKYAWEEGTPYNLSDPNFTEATLKPIGSKFVRGVANGVLGFAEVPGQIVKGAKEGAPDLGIIKGLWYWFSREVDGAYDIITCLLPNPKDTEALKFDEKWPWSALGDSFKK